MPLWDARIARTHTLAHLDSRPVCVYSRVTHSSRWKWRCQQPKWKCLLFYLSQRNIALHTLPLPLNTYNYKYILCATWVNINTHRTQQPKAKQTDRIVARDREGESRERKANEFTVFSLHFFVCRVICAGHRQKLESWSKKTYPNEYMRATLNNGIDIDGSERLHLFFSWSFFPTFSVMPFCPRSDGELFAYQNVDKSIFIAFLLHKCKACSVRCGAASHDGYIHFERSSKHDVTLSQLFFLFEHFSHGFVISVVDYASYSSDVHFWCFAMYATFVIVRRFKGKWFDFEPFGVHLERNQF